MRKKQRPWAFILMIVVILAVILWFLTALGNLERGSEEEGLEQLETALRRAAVACYASEGRYPPSLDYLTKHYGVQIGEEYLVFYEVFASNLMPDITIVKKDAK
ncbi:MAG: hypothetical protein E7224_01570 [Clostridiales bacterium]|nr:hypothetical protein [Clostridiales bacterium]